jgi:serine-type D-Ala-D-Ala endopeptidase (penicillin-binding protein 7)
VNACPRAASPAAYTSFVPFARFGRDALCRVAAKDPTMAVHKNRNPRLALLVAALVAAGSLLPMAYYHREADRAASQVAVAPTSAASASTAEPPLPPVPPGAEQVPPEESEPEHAATPGPTESFARAAGLNRTPDPLRLSASAALLLDADTGEVLVHKNDQAVLPIASVTKLMTTLLVIEAKQPMDEVLTITSDDVDTLRHSRSRLRPGTTLTREEALHLALMSSENRAAHALGRYYPGGLPKMVEAMNAKAKQLGMKDTTYVDPTGLSNKNQSTARDLALLVRTAAQNPLMRTFSTTPSHVANLGGHTLQYINSDRLVRNTRAGWDIDLQKTGYIVEAGHCLTLATRVAGHNLIMVLLDSGSNGTRVADAERLRHWALVQWGAPDVYAQARSSGRARPVAAVEHPAPARGHKAKLREHRKKSEADSKESAHHISVADKESEHPAEVAKKERARQADAHTKLAEASEAGPHQKAGGKSGRVHQSFTVAHAEPKS